MLREHYKIETDVARVYKVRARARRMGWGWAIATIREWPGGGQLDVQSDFGNYAYAWSAIGDRSLRQFLCGLSFDYFMNKAAQGSRVFDEEATVRSIKAEIFDRHATGMIDRATAHEWRDDLDDIGHIGCEHVFAERVQALDWFYQLYDYPPSVVMRESGQARAFWEGPWQALRAHWRQETEAEARAAQVAA
jgi:hypothetical protein